MQYYILQLLAPLGPTNFYPCGEKSGEKIFFRDMGPLLKKKLFSTHGFNTTAGQQCFIYNVVRLWNDLPPDIQQTDTPSKFDSSVIDWLLTKRLSDFGI